MRSAMIASVVLFACAGCNYSEPSAAQPSSSQTAAAGEPGVGPERPPVAPAAALGDATYEAQLRAQTARQRKQRALEEAAAFVERRQAQSAAAAERAAVIAAVQAQVEQQRSAAANPPYRAALPSASPAPPRSDRPMTEKEALIAAVQAQVARQRAIGLAPAPEPVIAKDPPGGG